MRVDELRNKLAPTWSRTRADPMGQTARKWLLLGYYSLRVTVRFTAACQTKGAANRRCEYRLLASRGSDANKTLSDNDRAIPGGVAALTSRQGGTSPLHPRATRPWLLAIP